MLSEWSNFKVGGEPTLNQRLSDMSKIAKSHFPDATIQLVTNAQSKQHDWNFEHAFDAIVYSIDGVDQQSYCRYREGADFDRSIEYMRKQIAATNQRNQKVKHIWKYIIFDHTDSDDQLLKLLALATEIGVDELRLTFTQYGPVSRRFFPAAQVLRSIASDRSLCDVNDTITFQDAVSALNNSGIFLPLPKDYFQAPDELITFSVVMSAGSNIKANVAIIKDHLANGNIDEARRFLVRGMLMLHRLYGCIGYNWISQEDERIADTLQALSAGIPEAELDGFYRCYADLRPDQYRIHQLTRLSNNALDAHQRIAELELTIAGLTKQIDSLTASKSWKLTAPLRQLNKFLSSSV